MLLLVGFESLPADILEISLLFIVCALLLTKTAGPVMFGLFMLLVLVENRVRVLSEVGSIQLVKRERGREHTRWLRMQLLVDLDCLKLFSRGDGLLARTSHEVEDLGDEELG